MTGYRLTLSGSLDGHAAMQARQQRMLTVLIWVCWSALPECAVLTLQACIAAHNCFEIWQLGHQTPF
jgi:hypothetical protein